MISLADVHRAVTDQLRVRALTYALAREDATGERTPTPEDHLMTGASEFARIYSERWNEFNRGTSTRMPGLKGAYEHWLECPGCIDGEEC